MSSAWKARLLPASWRGIPFFVDSHELSGGRHAVPHEPPDRTTNFTEDVGRKSKVFRIDAHIIGDNYFFIRDALIDAMEQRGPGTLVHPYLGIKQVQPDGYSFREETGQGRIAFFSLSFIEAGQPSFPFAEIDKITSFFTAVATAIAQVKNAFQLAFSIAQLPAFAVEGFQLQIQDFVTTVQGGFKNVRLDSTQHAVMTKKTADISANAGLLTSNPATNAEETDGIIDGLKTLVPDPPANDTIDTSSGRDDKLAVFNSLIVFGADNENLPETTPTRIREKANALAYADMIQQLALIHLAEQVVSKQFKSNQEAERTRQIVSDGIESQLRKSRTLDEVFQALEQVNAKMVAAVPNTSSSLFNESELNLIESVPSIVLAYDLYQSPDNERDIIDRNKVRNPGFVQGSVTVLSK